MEIIKKLFRNTLTEETVNITGLFINDSWLYNTENIVIPPLAVNYNNAVVIGNGVSVGEFDLTKILPYRESTPWGEVTDWITKRQTQNFSTYGCNALYRNFKPDYLVLTGKGIIEEVAQSTVDKPNIVYANTKFLELYPNKFSFLPQNPDFNSGAIAAYMAAFDGHKTIYLLGFDGIDSSDNIYNIFAGTPNYPNVSATINEDYWNKSLQTVMHVYSDIEFVRVCPTKNYRQPAVWKDCTNFRQIDFRQFVLEADI
jgi:hypothetical protein